MCGSACVSHDLSVCRPSKDVHAYIHGTAVRIAVGTACAAAAAAAAAAWAAAWLRSAHTCLPIAAIAVTAAGKLITNLKD